MGENDTASLQPVVEDHRQGDARAGEGTTVTTSLRDHHARYPYTAAQYVDLRSRGTFSRFAVRLSHAAAPLVIVPEPDTYERRTNPRVAGSPLNQGHVFCARLAGGAAPAGHSHGLGGRP